MHSQVSVHTLRTFEEVRGLSSAWRSWQYHPNSDLDFYTLIMGSRPEIVRPHVIVVSRQGRPDAILVGRIQCRRLELKFGYAQIASPRANSMEFIYAGLLGNASLENCQLLTEEIVDGLRRHEADLATLNFVNTDSPLWKAAQDMPRWASRDYWPVQQVHRSLRLRDNQNGFLETLPAKRRKNHRWQARRFQEAIGGGIRIECYSEVATLGQMFHDVEQVAEKTYQRGLGVGFVDNREMRERMTFSANNGSLRSYVLYVANQPCAFWIGTTFQSKFYSSFMGYDPAYMQYSPGMYLIVEVIESICADRVSRPVTEIDFGLGDAQYKEVLANQQWKEGSLCIFAPTIKGLFLNAIRTPTIAANQYGKAILRRAQLLNRVKRWWRSQRRQI